MVPAFSSSSLRNLQVDITKPASTLNPEVSLGSNATQGGTRTEEAFQHHVPPQLITIPERIFGMLLLLFSGNSNPK
jgi:hypothetical protein